MKKLKILSFIITALSVVTISIVGQFNSSNNNDTPEEIGQVENVIQEESFEDEENINEQEKQEIAEQKGIQDNNSTDQEAKTQTNMQQDTNIKETTPSNPTKQNSNNKQTNVVQNIPTQKSTPTTQTQKQEQQVQQTKETANNKETFKINNSIINKMQSIINSNPSSFMKQFGYNIVVDSSIVNKTTGFTYTETRVKNAIANSFGTIRIYAQDYYVGNELRWTQSFIL